MFRWVLICRVRLSVSWFAGWLRICRHNFDIKVHHNHRNHHHRRCCCRRWRHHHHHDNNDINNNNDDFHSPWIIVCLEWYSVVDKNYKPHSLKVILICSVDLLHIDTPKHGIYECILPSSNRTKRLSFKSNFCPTQLPTCIKNLSRLMGQHREPSFSVFVHVTSCHHRQKTDKYV